MKFNFSSTTPKDKNTALVSWKKQKESQVLVLPGGQKNIVLGVAGPEKMTRRKLIILARQIITFAKANQVKKIALKLEDFSFPKAKVSKEEIAEIFATNFLMADFEFVNINLSRRRAGILWKR